MVMYPRLRYARTYSANRETGPGNLDIEVLPVIRFWCRFKCRIGWYLGGGPGLSILPPPDPVLHRLCGMIILLGTSSFKQTYNLTQNVF